MKGTAVALTEVAQTVKNTNLTSKMIAFFPLLRLSLPSGLPYDRVMDRSPKQTVLAVAVKASLQRLTASVS